MWFELEFEGLSWAFELQLLNHVFCFCFCFHHRYYHSIYLEDQSGKALFGWFFPWTPVREARDEGSGPLWAKSGQYDRIPVIAYTHLCVFGWTHRNHIYVYIYIYQSVRLRRVGIRSCKTYLLDRSRCGRLDPFRRVVLSFCASSDCVREGGRRIPRRVSFPLRRVLVLWGVCWCVPQGVKPKSRSTGLES